MNQWANFDIGTIIGIIGALIGVAFGVFGTVLSITRTNPGEERKLMVKASVIIWIKVMVFISLVIFLPAPWKFWLWILYVPLLFFCIWKINRSMQKLRETA